MGTFGSKELQAGNNSNGIDHNFNGFDTINRINDGGI